jgi:signal transduction histidine kinase
MRVLHAPPPGVAEPALEREIRLRTRELAVAREEMEAFVASVSHDLRSPVAVVRAFSGVLLERASLEPEVRSHVQRIEAAATRMDEIIEALLTLSALGERPLESREVDVASIAREVAAECAAVAGRDVPLQVDCTAALRADPALVRVALSNLLGNAWKFTAATPRPEVAVRCEPRGAEEVVLSVRDNGAGFDDTYAGELFKPFRRLHLAREFPGLGIGLSTVHRIAQRHGGHVEAQGRPGQGACIRMVLPRGGPDLVHACGACDDARAPGGCAAACARRA